MDFQNEIALPQKVKAHSMGFHDIGFPAKTRCRSGLFSFPNLSVRKCSRGFHRRNVSDRSMVQGAFQAFLGAVLPGISGCVDVDLSVDRICRFALAGMEGNAYAMAFWAGQISLNTLWTPVFFRLRRIKAALAIIAALWMMVAGATFTHFQLDFWAGLAFLPYLVWLTIAVTLNVSIVKLNQDVVPLNFSEL